MKFSEKYVAFVDVLGFKNMIQEAESGTGRTLLDLHEMLNDLGATGGRKSSRLCPSSSYIAEDMDFRVAKISDCVIVSAESSASGIINLLEYCWGVAIALLDKGVMIRGYITHGSIYHESYEIYGSAYQKAVEFEKNVKAFQRTIDDGGTPFIEIDQAVCDRIRGYGDRCVNEMFKRYVFCGDDFVAIFPFNRLRQDIIINPMIGFDEAAEKRKIGLMRAYINDLISGIGRFVDTENPRAVRKMEHYKIALRAQLDKCDGDLATIDTWMGRKRD